MTAVATDPAAPSRRGFLKISAATAGGLLIGFHLTDAEAATPRFAPNAFIRIDRDSNVTLVMPNSEMGQGVYTAHSQLLAEELDVSLSRVAYEIAPPNDELYGGPRKRQTTGGSSSVRGGFYVSLRQAGADARALLVLAAARGWGVDPASCRTADGRVFHDASNRSAEYGALADRAAQIPAPSTPAPVKDPKDFKLIGKSVHRLDTREKVNGSLVYGLDALSGKTKIAIPHLTPVLGGKVLSVDDSKTLAVPGVLQVVVLEDIVAVVAENTWAALKGSKALVIEWDDGPYGNVDTAKIWADLRAGDSQEGANQHTDGEPDQALTEGDLLEAAYEMPMLAHAPMEVNNCTVHFSGGRCELWSGSQSQTQAHREAARAAELPIERVTFHNHLLGGGFGRRLDADAIYDAVRIGKQVEGPVKVMWTREEDMRHDVYRPAYRNTMRATLKDGRVHGWSHKVASGSIIMRLRGGAPLDGGKDSSAVEGAAESYYDIPNRRVNYVQVEPGAVKLGWWRGVGPNNAIFAIESFMDELALKAGEDPIAFRLKHLGNNPRLANALRLVAGKSDWGKPLGKRRGRGVSIQVAFGSYLATVADVEVDTAGHLHIHKFTSAIDCGVMVNPNGVVAQMEGGMIYGITAALYGNVDLDRGRVVQSNFNDYRALRINEAPNIEVHLIRSSEAPGGVGEPPVSSTHAALLNAIAAATGIRLRSVPIDYDILAGRKPA